MADNKWKENDTAESLERSGPVYFQVILKYSYNKNIVISDTIEMYKHSTVCNKMYLYQFDSPHELSTEHFIFLRWYMYRYLIKHHQITSFQLYYTQIHSTFFSLSLFAYFLYNIQNGESFISYLFQCHRLYTVKGNWIISLGFY
jgi:hypothetical protein